jgi:hypothetical protein
MSPVLLFNAVAKDYVFCTWDRSGWEEDTNDLHERKGAWVNVLGHNAIYHVEETTLLNLSDKTLMLH